MGMSQSLYLGAYARCLNPKAEKPEKRRTCPKVGCKAHKQYVNSPHCSYCGTAVKEIDVMEKRESIDSDAARTEFRESLHMIGQHNPDTFEGKDCWAPNVQRTRIEEYFTGEDPIEDSVPADEKKKFEKKYAKELEILRRHYGEKNVEVRWGLLGEYS